MDFMKTILPWIGAAATGNVPALVGMAANQLSGALGVDVKPTADAISKAFSGATPEQIQAAKLADQDFALKMQALGFAQVKDLEAIAMANISDARAMAAKTGDTNTPRWLAVFAVACFVGLCVAVLKGVEPAQGMKDTFLILVGAAIAVFKDVYGYYFGSSSGSRENQEALRKAAS